MYFLSLLHHRYGPNALLWLKMILFANFRSHILFDILSRLFLSFLNKMNGLIYAGALILVMLCWYMNLILLLRHFLKVLTALFNTSFLSIDQALQRINGFHILITGCVSLSAILTRGSSALSQNLHLSNAIIILTSIWLIHHYRG